MFSSFATQHCNWWVLLQVDTNTTKLERKKISIKPPWNSLTHICTFQTIGVSFYSPFARSSFRSTGFRIISWLQNQYDQQKCGSKQDSRARSPCLLHWPTHHSDGVEDNGSNESKTSVVKFVITLSGLQELDSDLLWQSGKLELLFDSEYNTGNFSHGGLLVRNTGNSGPKIWMLCINEPSDWRRNSK
jgi:hypothetical protein